MAIKPKTNTIESQIDYIDTVVAEMTGIDLRAKAREAIAQRESMRWLGIQIIKGLAFDPTDNQLVIVPNGDFSTIMH